MKVQLLQSSRAAPFGGAVHLHRRPSFQEVANLIDNPDFKLRYPDRRATFLARTPQMTQFLGNNQSILDIQDESNKLLKQQLAQLQMKQLARDNKISLGD